MIPFNIPPVVGTEMTYLREAIDVHKKLCGDGVFSKKCQNWLEQNINTSKALLTPSCTAALEMAALLIDIQPGDEVIMPSYTFVSTANAFTLRGARIVFVDICPEDMNIDPKKIEVAITPKTKAIVVVHYAGVGCAMEHIMAIAAQYSLYVIEDAAQAVKGFYRGQPLGSIGHLGCVSFHETKNYTAGGEGGALLINDERFIERAEVIREKGTNRSQFVRGQVDKYTWRDIGSSYLPSELQAAYLLAQLEAAEEINKWRCSIWSQYHEALKELEEQYLIRRPHVPEGCTHNAHMYYLKFPSMEQRTNFIKNMQLSEVQTSFHYIPLHSSPAGLRYSRFHGKDEFTTIESSSLVRLPLWYNMAQTQIEQVITHTLRCVRGGL